MERLSRLVASRLFTAVLIAVAVLSTVFELQTYAVVFYVAVACVILMLPSSASRLLPVFTVTCAMVHTCYGKSDEFSDVFTMAVPLIAATLFHIIFYKKKPKKGGATLPALIGVAVIVLIGGLGMNDPTEYLKPQNLYYYLGLSVFPVIAYFVSRMMWSGEETEAVKDSFIEALYAGAITCALIIFAYYVVDLWEFVETFTVLKPFTFNPGRNGMAAIMIPGIAAGFAYAKRNPGHIAVIAFIYVSAIMSASRSNMLFSAAVIALGLVYLAITDRAHRKAYITVICVLAACAVIAIPFVIRMLSGRFETGGFFSSDLRIALYKQGFKDFAESPIHGLGIIYGGNTRYDHFAFDYEIIWYHDLFIQIIASFGILGAVAYAVQFFCRLRAISEAKCDKCSVLGLAYIGLLLLSLTEPGIFAPAPTALVITLIFACVDLHVDGLKEKARSEKKAKRNKKKHG